MGQRRLNPGLLTCEGSTPLINSPTNILRIYFESFNGFGQNQQRSNANERSYPQMKKFSLNCYSSPVRVVLTLVNLIGL